MGNLLANSGYGKCEGNLLCCTLRHVCTWSMMWKQVQAHIVWVWLKTTHIERKIKLKNLFSVFLIGWKACLWGRMLMVFLIISYKPLQKFKQLLNSSIKVRKVFQNFIPSLIFCVSVSMANFLSFWVDVDTGINLF